MTHFIGHENVNIDEVNKIIDFFPQKKDRNGVKEQPKEQVRWPPPNVRLKQIQLYQITD